MSFMDGLEDSDEQEAVVPHKTTVLSPKATVEQGLDAIKQDIIRECAGVVSGITRFADIDPSDPAPPQEWIEQLGIDEAMKVHRVARMSNLSKKDAPIGIEICSKMLLGIINADARSKAPKQEMNISLVGMPTPKVNYAEIEEHRE